MIEPKVLKGFRDTLPEAMIAKKEIIKILEEIFERFGFVPIDTPALEYSEILLGKGGGETDKQVYRFNDHGGRDVALRFDLTVPLARFVSQHYNELTFPFKRYHIAPVWRGENTQKGRYREFYQCDFDILGTNSLNSDIEILLIIREGLLRLKIDNFKIYINNRKILNAFLKKFGLEDKSVLILRTLDKIYKIGIDKVEKELVDEIGVNSTLVDKMLNFLNLKEGKFALENEEIFNTLEKYKAILQEEYNKPVFELEYVFRTLSELDIINNYSFNPAITRGLDYYTGNVFETFVLDKTDFGSICSGGRYDNLTALYSQVKITGVGASFGLDRIMALLEEKGILTKKESNTDILIFNLDDSLNVEYHKLASEFRKRGLNVETVFEKVKINNQFKIAEKKGIKFVLFAGEEEIKEQKYNVKNILEKREYTKIPLDEIVKLIKEEKK